MRCLSDYFKRQSAQHAIDGLRAIFQEVGIETASLDARLLVQHVLKIDHAQIIQSPDALLSSSQMDELLYFAKRRVEGEPIARIFGSAEFWSLPFHLSNETLVPRPDTETVVEQTLSLLDGRQNDNLRLLDLGTGSGCLLLSLLSELPYAVGVGVDKSEAALQTAKLNARSLNLIDRSTFIVSDWTTAVNGNFDVIVSNPPYICTNEIGTLSKEVAQQDPHLALDGGGDGLEAYRLIFSQVINLISPHGIMVVEFGDGQAQSLIDLLKQSQLNKHIEQFFIKCDIAGRERSLGIQFRE